MMIETLATKACLCGRKPGVGMAERRPSRLDAVMQRHTTHADRYKSRLRPCYGRLRLGAINLAGMPAARRGVRAPPFRHLDNTAVGIRLANGPIHQGPPP